VRVILKVRKKGILILPKRLREVTGIEEGDDVIVEAEEGRLIIKVLRPKVVDVDPDLVERFLREEYELEKRKYEGLF